MTLPTHIVLTEQYVRVECDLKDDGGELLYPGMWIEARKNLTMGERMALVDAFHEIDERLQDQTDELMDRGEDIDNRIAALDDAELTPREKRHARRALRDEQAAVIKEQTVMIEAAFAGRRALITPHIRAWNIHRPDHSPLPPPSEGGSDVLMEVYTDLLGWMINVCTTAYSLGKGLGTTKKSGDAQVPTPEPTNAGPQVISTSPTRRSRKK